MPVYLARRVIEVIPTVFLITLLVFSLMRVSGADPIAAMLGPQSTPEMVEEVRKELGLNDPLHIQYLRWIGRLVQGDLGKSIRSREHVSEMIVIRAPTTIYLACAATLFSIAAGVSAGTLAALRRGTVADQVTMFISTLGLAAPNYLMALLLILAFGVYWRIFPIAAFSVDLAKDPLAAMKNLVLPTVALGASYAALLARLTRSSLLEVLGADYIRTARAKGLPGWRITGKHAMRNALIPVVTVIAMNFVHLLGGSIIIEEIFGLPGIGALLIRSIFERDFPVIQGVTLITGLAFVLASLVTDLMYALIDPRIQYA